VIILTGAVDVFNLEHPEMSVSAEVLNRPPRLVSNIESEIAELIPRRTNRQSPAPQPMPDYVHHLVGVTQVGALSAEAVARDYETAAQEIEAMGNELVGAARRCEEMTADVHNAISFMRETASAYREEAKRLFARIEACAVMTEEVRKTCQSFKDKISEGRRGEVKAEIDKAECEVTANTA
jgi:hypothetical protein